MVGYYVNIVYGGLTFRYTDDFDFYLSVAESALPSDRSVLKGLCGNYNGDYEDDMYLLGGNRATSVAAYGNSYALTTVSGPVSIYIMLVREILTLRINYQIIIIQFKCDMQPDLCRFMQHSLK